MTPVLPWLPSGTVYGPLLNLRREYALWTPKMSEPPYQAAPRAPVLYVKTANTFATHGATVAVPAPVHLGATLGLLIGDESNRATALAQRAQAAIDSGVNGWPIVAGCVLLNDLSLPHASYYRPPIRFRNRDGFLVCGTPVAPLTAAQIGGALKPSPLADEPWLALVASATRCRSRCASTANACRRWRSPPWCATRPRCWPTWANS